MVSKVKISSVTCIYRYRCTRSTGVEREISVRFGLTALCLANTGIVNVLVEQLNSKPDEVTGYECGLYSTKGGRLMVKVKVKLLIKPE